MTIIQTITPNSFLLPGVQSINSLRKNHHLKTFDIGLDGNTVSTNPFGDILQLSCFHPLHGVVVSCPYSQFDGDRFYDSEYVREYRKKLLDYVRSGRRGSGIHLRGTISDVKSEIVADNNISVTYSLEQIQAATTISVCKDRGVIQSTVLRSTSTQTVDVDYTLAIDVSVNRASYGQLTEGGPIPIPPPRNKFQLFNRSRAWAVINRNLDAMIQGALYCDGLPVCLEPIEAKNVALGRPMSMAFHGMLQLRSGQTRTLTSTYRLQPGSECTKVPSPLVSLQLSQEEGWKIRNANMRLIVKGNLWYIIGNCTIPVSNTATCFITDHVALPLGWNRDNYWQIRYLLDIHQNINRLVYDSTAKEYLLKIQTVVRQHLSWVFRVAQRPYGYWHRSYLATGMPKDGPVFQQDQQCYPILELCDFLEHFPSEIDFAKSLLGEETIPSILSILEAHRDSSTGLYSTEETPGDDAVEHPFHFSSHILLWHTFSRLAKSLSILNYVHGTLNPVYLEQKAKQIRISTLRHFVARNPATDTTMFAYLTDGAGVHTFYHDANDLPTLFIPSWNFATPSSPEYALWTRTMAFGLSSTNTDGFFPQGTYGGLGSVHTRGPWPLGFAQEFIYANIIGDVAAAEDSWRRIQGSMFWDGLFSEAVNAETGDCTSKAWFSWPGSVIGSALLKFGIPGKKNCDHEW